MQVGIGAGECLISATDLIGQSPNSKGLAEYVEWRASMIEFEAKRKLKSAELEVIKSQIGKWINYISQPSNSKPIHNKNFTGKVVEVVSGDCVIVADDSIPFSNPSVERRVNLSSIRSPKMGNPRKEDNIPERYARESKEFLQSRLTGCQVNVSMEYSRKVTMKDAAGPPESRLMDFGLKFIARWVPYLIYHAVILYALIGGHPTTSTTWILHRSCSKR